MLVKEEELLLSCRSRGRLERVATSVRKSDPAEMRVMMRSQRVVELGWSVEPEVGGRRLDY